MSLSLAKFNILRELFKQELYLGGSGDGLATFFDDPIWAKLHERRELLNATSERLNAAAIELHLACSGKTTLERVKKAGEEFSAACAAAEKIAPSGASGPLVGLIET